MAHNILLHRDTKRKSNYPVMLNLFQHPGAVSQPTDTFLEANDRAWILKRVQDDGKLLERGSTLHV